MIQYYLYGAFLSFWCLTALVLVNLQYMEKKVARIFFRYSIFMFKGRNFLYVVMVNYSCNNSARHEQMFRDHCNSHDFIHLNSSVPLLRTPDLPVLLLSNYGLFLLLYCDPYLPLYCGILLSLSSAIELLYPLVYD